MCIIFFFTSTNMAIFNFALDYVIYSCDQKAKHFHCCQCPQTYINKAAIKRHLCSFHPLPPAAPDPPWETPSLPQPFLLRAESPRDFTDMLFSWKHIPNICFYDFARGLATHSSLRRPEAMPFTPFEGRLAEYTENNITAAESGTLKSTLDKREDGWGW